MPKSDIFVFLGGIKAWAILCREITMTMNGGRGIELAHSLEYSFQLCALIVGSGVLCFFTVSGQSPYIANADALGVVP